MTIDDLKQLETETEKYLAVFEVIVEKAIEDEKKPEDYTIEVLYENAKKLGYPPLEYITSIDKLFDYDEIVDIWAEEFGLEVGDDDEIDTKEDWYIKYKDGSIGISNPVNYEKAEELFPNQKIKLVSQHFLDIKDISDDGIKGYFYSLIQDSQEIGITDVHFEIQKYGFEIKGRLIGEMVQLDVFPMEKSYKLQQIIKNIAADYSNIDTEQTRKRQDARIEIQERKLDLRLAFSPSIIEKFQNLVIRLLSKEHTRIKGQEDIEKLGYLPEDAEIILGFNELKSGLNLMSGATGSGKSRSINTFLSLIPKKYSVKTVEDPIEYELENAVQHQTFEIIKEKEEDSIVMDYLAYLLAFMRQDPDIIFVGEWRKMEALTNTILYASETGHLVFSTLHASRVVNIPNLLISQYGLKKEDLVNNLNILINQKLVKKVCPHCSSKRQVTDEDVKNIIKRTKMIDAEEKFQKIIGEEVSVVNEEGCEKCRIYHPQKKDRLLFAGYQGRTVLYEYMPFDMRAREMLTETTNSIEIERMLNIMSQAKKAKTYVDIAIEKLKLGEVDLETVQKELAG